MNTTDPLYPKPTEVVIELSNGPDDEGKYRFFRYWIDRYTGERRGQIFKSDLEQHKREIVEGGRTFRIIDSRQEVFYKNAYWRLNTMKGEREYLKPYSI